MTVRTRILLFEDEATTRRMLTTYLRSKGFEVLDFSTPVNCALVTQQKCTCPREYACADVIITDMNMPHMSGLDLIRFQMEKGCHAPPQNKAVISAALSPEQVQEFQALGCYYLRKPFKLQELLDWVHSCEQNIPANRKLTEVEEAWLLAGSPPVVQVPLPHF